MFRLGCNQSRKQPTGPCVSDQDASRWLTRYVTKPIAMFEFPERFSLAVPLQCSPPAPGGLVLNIPRRRTSSRRDTAASFPTVSNTGSLLRPGYRYQYMFFHPSKQKSRTNDCVITCGRQSQGLHFTHKATFRTQPQEPAEIRTVCTLPCLS